MRIRFVVHCPCTRRSRHWATTSSTALRRLCDVVLHPSDVTGDPGLGAFVDTGAPGGGHVPLLAGSPAIDAADTSDVPGQRSTGPVAGRPLRHRRRGVPGIGGRPESVAERHPAATGAGDHRQRPGVVDDRAEPGDAAERRARRRRLRLDLPVGRGRALRRGHGRQLVALDGQRLDLRRAPTTRLAGRAHHRAGRGCRRRPRS